MNVRWLIYESARHALVQIARAKLFVSGERRLAFALGARSCELRPQIEGRRAALLKDHSPLADGSLGRGGPYDANQTVASACRVSKRAAPARLLYSLAAEYRPETLIELGTNVGISSAYFAAAGCNVTTLEASPYRLQVARKLHKSLELDIEYVEGLFSETLGPTLDRIAPVERAFIDGHHQYRPTLEYFETIAAKSAPGCVFIFDDIRWSDGMKRAWAELRKNPAFGTVADIGDMGVAILAT